MDSFLGSQKFSIAKALRKKYSAYINFKDNIDTLLFKMISDLFNVVSGDRRASSPTRA